MSTLEKLEKDAYWMRRALELARRGIGVSSPNPAVGCVILDRAGQVVGEGWHEYDLMDHAEVVALKEASQHAGERLRGGTAYVTLEPCNHTGRTGPCTEVLIAAGLGAWRLPPSTPIRRLLATAWKRCVPRASKPLWGSARPRRGESMKALLDGASTSDRWC